MIDRRPVHGTSQSGVPSREPNLDPRIRRTRRALQDALAQLVERDEPVSMSAVAQLAGLSRQVLHTHYDSIEHLAAEVLARRLLEGAGHDAPVGEAAGAQALILAVDRDGLAPFLGVIRADRRAFLALRRLAHGRTTAVLARVFLGLATGLGDGVTDGPDVGPAARFVAGGMTTVVDDWLATEQPSPPEQLAVLLKGFARAVFAADDGGDRNGPERSTS